MKCSNYITALLTTYLFALMLLPCTDNCNAYAQANEFNCQTNQEEHQDENDACSPFCYCTCCSTIMIVIDLPAPIYFPHKTVQCFARFEQLFFSKAFTFIWQPPKLV